MILQGGFGILLGCRERAFRGKSKTGAVCSSRTAGLLPLALGIPTLLLFKGAILLSRVLLAILVSLTIVRAREWQGPY